MYADYVQMLERVSEPLQFKSHPAYQGILEHVSLEQGYGYLDLCLNSLGTWRLDPNEVADFATLNDSIGSPVTYNVGGIQCSPTSLRYAHLILQTLKIG